MNIQNPQQFGHVAVLMGGQSSEREISLQSGTNVLQALQAQGVHAFAIDGIPELLTYLQNNPIDVVFNILHGRGGEDGVLQGLLESLNIPYTGSGILGSALSMDKVRSKWIWQQQQLPTPEFSVCHHEADASSIIDTMRLPVIVKPAHEGSSVGITRVHQATELTPALQHALQYDHTVLVEELIIGDEYTVGIIGDVSLPSIHIVPTSAYYDYHAKYIADDTQYICQDLTHTAEDEMQKLALRAFQSVNAREWGRVDIMRDKQGKNWLLEVNTVPGMTSHSLIPKAADAIGISFSQLVWRILEMAVSYNRGRN